MNPLLKARANMELAPRTRMHLLIATAAVFAAVGVCYGGEGVFPHKMPELDIQECVGLTTDKTAPWAKKWDRIFQSNLIQHKNRFTPEKVQLQDSVPTEMRRAGA